MKRNVKFFTIVISLLLLSSIILTGCMYAIAADNGEMKPYDLNGQKQNSDSSGGNIVEDAPLAQDSLQAKFEAMYEISEDGKTITVISEDYLNNYWRSNYEKEVIHALTTEEVYFIIQDSIRIYEEYDEVVLTGFASVSSMMQVAERFPFVKDEVIKTQPDVTPYYDWDDTEAIYEIILYRLKALSSPKAFFTGEEAIRSVGRELGIDSTMLPWTTFYIPNYSENTDRSTVLKAIGYAVIPNIDYHVDVISDLFSFCNKNGAYINFESKTNGQTTKVYPTVELDNKTKPYFSIKLPELNNAVLEHKQDYKLYLDGELLVGGMAEDFANLCLYDITGDGVPELCFVMATGSGMVDYNIVIIDYQTKESIFSLSDRGNHDYKLFFRDGQLCVLERKYMSIEFTRTGVLTYDGSKISVSWDTEVNYPYDLPTGIPFDPYKDMIEDSNSVPPVNNEKDPTDVHAEDFERYYPDELFNLYDLSKIVSWDEIYAAEQNLLKNNASFYNEQLPPLYLMIKELGVTKEEFIRVNDQLNDEQIEVLFNNKKNETIQRELKLDTAFFYKGRLYNIYELSALEPIQLKEMVDEVNMIDYLNVLESIYAGKGNDSEILNDYIDFIKNKIDK